MNISTGSKFILHGRREKDIVAEIAAEIGRASCRERV